jgi:hypothetical protein
MRRKGNARSENPTHQLLPLKSREASVHRIAGCLSSGPAVVQLRCPRESRPIRFTREEIVLTADINIPNRSVER